MLGDEPAFYNRHSLLPGRAAPGERKRPMCHGGREEMRTEVTTHSNSEEPIGSEESHHTN